MKQFFISADKSATASTTESTQETKPIEKFMEWINEVESSGNQKIPSQDSNLEGRATRVIDGPFVEIKELIGKFTGKGES